VCIWYGFKLKNLSTIFLQVHHFATMEHARKIAVPMEEMMNVTIHCVDKEPHVIKKPIHVNVQQDRGINDCIFMIFSTFLQDHAQTINAKKIAQKETMVAQLVNYCVSMEHAEYHVEVMKMKHLAKTMNVLVVVFVMKNPTLADVQLELLFALMELAVATKEKESAMELLMEYVKLVKDVDVRIVKENNHHAMVDLHAAMEFASVHQV
jgi:hypothetical protein